MYNYACANFKHPKCLYKKGLSFHHVIPNTELNAKLYGDDVLQSEENCLPLCVWCHDHQAEINWIQEKRKLLEIKYTNKMGKIYFRFHDSSKDDIEIYYFMEIINSKFDHVNDIEERSELIHEDLVKICNKNNFEVHTPPHNKAGGVHDVDGEIANGNYYIGFTSYESEDADKLVWTYWKDALLKEGYILKGSAKSKQSILRE